MELSTSHFEIKALKSAILQRRYQVAALVNKELLTLYFAVGKFISRKIEEEKWRVKVIENLSSDLQLELPGLRKFSARNMNRRRFFFESWKEHSLISPSPSTKLEDIDLQEIIFIKSVMAKLKNSFPNVSFTHHIEVLQSIKLLEEKIFYIKKTASEFWSLSILKNQLMD